MPSSLVTVAVVVLVAILLYNNGRSNTSSLAEEDVETAFYNSFNGHRPCPPSLPQRICPNLFGNEARTCVAELFRPTHPKKYWEARKLLFGRLADVNNNKDHNNKYWQCVYGGFTAKRGSNTGNGKEVEPFNIEHIVPQSVFKKREYIKTDLHHLFIAHEKLNAARSNYRFGQVRNAKKRKICGGIKCRWEDDPSAGVDDEAGVSFQGPDGTWLPPARHRGDVARAVAYVYAVYAEEMQWETPDRVLSVHDMLAWHSDDPVTPQDLERSGIIKCEQGNDNPFVVDETLMERMWSGKKL